MKIRNGFVSNSSSSSFLIIYKSLKDFCKFEMFECFETFYNDLKNADPSIAFNHIRAIIDGALYRLYDRLENFMFLNTENDVWDLLEMSRVPYEEYRNLEEKILNLGHQYQENVFKKYPDIRDICFNAEGNYYCFIDKEQMNFIQECEKKYRDTYYDEAFQKELDEGIENLTMKIQDALTEKGYQIRSIRYEDHDDKGYIMEQGFMPFLKRNPERKYEIFTTNEH